MKYVASPRPAAIGMTRQQLRLLDFICQYFDERRVPPSFDEMKDALGLRSKSGIHRMIIALVSRGYIARMPDRARSIVVLRRHQDAMGPGPDERGLVLMRALHVLCEEAADDPKAGEIADRLISYIGRTAAFPIQELPPMSQPAVGATLEGPRACVPPSTQPALPQAAPVLPPEVR